MTNQITVRKIHMGHTFTKKGEGEFIHMGGTSWFVFDGDEVVAGAFAAKWAAEVHAQHFFDSSFKMTSQPRMFVAGR